ncbi:hypothetical protein CWATWH0402_1189 [Crocosphaera watsonii WH 0402]|uniref:Uncharacterized protein n=1 Tax=Crocosphaera watsonii WH 0402 TaxID=1284629 RepID=T2JNK5_CROWT|nr:hypothetical protein CWATWH0402_1189 [Crocosphaera watsonii WH 0402]
MKPNDNNKYYYYLSLLLVLEHRYNIRIISSQIIWRLKRRITDLKK